MTGTQVDMGKHHPPPTLRNSSPQFSTITPREVCHSQDLTNQKSARISGVLPSPSAPRRLFVLDARLQLCRRSRCPILNLQVRLRRPMASPIRALPPGMICGRSSATCIRFSRGRCRPKESSSSELRAIFATRTLIASAVKASATICSNTVSSIYCAATRF